MKTPRIHVTDHALVRYLERVRGESLDAVRAEIAGLVETGVDLGASGVRVGGFVYKLHEDRVVTVMLACEPKLTTGGRAGPRGAREDGDV